MTVEHFEQIEDFCPICVAAPLAIAAGAASVASADGKKKRVNDLYKSSGTTMIVSAVALFVFYKYFADCKECNASA